MTSRNILIKTQSYRAMLSVAFLDARIRSQRRAACHGHGREDRRSVHHLRTTDGEAETVMIVADAKFVRGTSPASQQDLKVGDRVVIHAKPESGMLYATEAKIGERKDSAQH